MELTPLRYFTSIAAAGHMTKAARKLGVTQPALSAMLRKLEAEVGAELPHRGARGVELTDAGRVFLRHAEDAVRRADAGVVAVRELMGLEHGSIRVGGGATATTYLLPRVVSEVNRRHPGLRFYVREAGSAAVAAAVSTGELDLGIVTLPLKSPDSEALVATPLVEDELRLIEPGEGIKGQRDRGTKTAGKASERGTFRWTDLEGVPVVAFEAGTAVREIIDLASASAGVTLNVVMELRSIESIKQMVAAGIGVGFVSRFALRGGEGRGGRSSEGLACRDGKLSRRLAIVRRRDRVPSSAAAEFERVLLKTVRQDR